MNILLLGSGAANMRWAWKLAQSPAATKFYAAPGNRGIAEEAELVALDVTDSRSGNRLCATRASGLS